MITRLPEMFLSPVHVHDKMVLLEVASKLAVFLIHILHIRKEGDKMHERFYSEIKTI
jgi:hypothetical protein